MSLKLRMMPAHHEALVVTLRSYPQEEYFDERDIDHEPQSPSPTASSAQDQHETSRSLYSCCAGADRTDAPDSSNIGVISAPPSDSLPYRQLDHVEKDDDALVHGRFTPFPCDAIYTDARGVSRNVFVVGVEKDAGGDVM